MVKAEETSEGEIQRSVLHLLRALDLRKKYMRVSLQNKGWEKYAPTSPVRAVRTNGRPVIENDTMEIPSAKEFYSDLEYITHIIHHGPLKSFCFRRLENLDLQFKMHMNKNCQQEKNEQKNTSTRDFYTVVKTDTHIHHSSSMNSKRLLQFIKKKLRETPKEVVHRGDKEYTLEEVFEKINKKLENLCIDTLDTHSNLDTFHRFDRFNTKYNPYGTPLLREIFLKYDNHIDGRYLADITKEMIEEIEEKEYLRCEWGISIYGKKEEEIEILSAWIKRYKLKSSCIRWYLQVPRFYGVFRGYGQIKTYAEFLTNIFGRILEASQNEGSDDLSEFLEDVVGIDSVDDEGAKDKRNELEKEDASLWSVGDNPSYHYYMYHMYYNVAVINRVRASRGKNLLAFRPHSGESGELDHLASAFLTSKTIAHGIKLRKSPVLQYLYYLSQIGISMSPLSNNSLFLEYKNNPFPEFFRRGLNITLSTDDPLQFHYTREPLMEEYSVASQIWKLYSCDQCEIAKNSVLISNFPKKEKERWIGKYEKDGRLTNDPSKTNVPPTRFKYRMQRIREEYCFLKKYAYNRSE